MPSPPVAIFAASSSASRTRSSSPAGRAPSRSGSSASLVVALRVLARSTSRSTTRPTCVVGDHARRRDPAATRSASSRRTRCSRSRTGGARPRTSTSAAGAARRSARRCRTSSASTVLDVEPVGLAGSGGSTPLRLRVAGDPDTYLFGKLYAMNHVRADRWYKLGRTILYGRLEDESAVPVGAPARASTRTTRCGSCATPGSRPPQSYGIVELTPEREYLLVTEFFDGAQEIGDAEVDDDVIDEGLALIRKLWDAGLAHRDIKPANLLVQRRPRAAHRRRLRAGAPVAVAPGGRPRQHDARPRGAHRRRARLPARAALLHAGRDRRGVRRQPAASRARRSCARR